MLFQRRGSVVGSEEQRQVRLDQAADELNRHGNRQDGQRVVTRLADGFTLLRTSLYERVHRDVEQVLGRDSMFLPISEVKAEKVSKTEIELYQIAVASQMNRRRRYVGADTEWFWQWLARLRLGRAATDPLVIRRIGEYLALDEDHGRLAFTDVLAKALPESRRAPLVLFRLVPLAIQIVTAQAFGDRPTAEALRRQQVDILPAITDCRTCRGQLLESGTHCPPCGNPVWRFQWLTAAD